MSTYSGENSLQKRTAGGIRKLLALVGNLVFILLVLLIASMLFFLIQNKVSGGLPKVFGHHMYIVLSGSMAPEFDTGSVVFVKPKEPDQVQVGDVITFGGVNDPRALTTHRVVEIDSSDPQNIQFITKGDANDVTDPNPVSGDRLVGTLSFSIPYLGYLLNYGQTKQGMLFLVIVPAMFLIVTELFNLYTNTRQSKREEDEVMEGEDHFNRDFWS